MSNKAVEFFRRNMITILTVCGVIGGTIAGIILREVGDGKWEKRNIMYLAFPGEIFMRMLKCLIIPLLVSSVIQAIGSLDITLSKKIAIRAILYYTTTTLCAVVLGLILVVTIQPGVNTKRFTGEKPKLPERYMITQDSLLDLVRNMFPTNIVKACVAQSSTFLVTPDNISEILKIRNITDKEKATWDFSERYEDNTNVLGLVVFAIIFGITLGQMGQNGKHLLDFFAVLAEAMMNITSWVICISPVGVFFLVTAKVLEVDDFGDLVGRLGKYFITVLLGLFIHGFGTLSVIFFIISRKLPFGVYGQLSQVFATAFGTASSSATMPVTIQNLDKMGVDPRVTRFVIPVGASLNMDGTALYEAVAAIFIAQLNSTDVSLGKMVAVCLTATAASVGAAGIPQAGLVTMVMVLDTVGLPSDEVINIIAVDWLLDRFRTTVNVMGDSLGAVIVDKLSEGELGKITEADRINAEPQELLEITKEDSHI